VSAASDSSPSPRPRLISNPTADPRAERTRQQIFAAVRDLTARGTASLTVGDIVLAAGISRSSFYAHFGGVDELSEEMFRAQFSQIEQDSVPLGSTSVRSGYTRLVEHMVENQPLYSSLVVFPPARGAYDDLVLDFCTRLLISVAATSRVPPGLRTDLAITYVAGGALTVIGSWMSGDVDVSDDELVDQLVALLPHWLSG